MNTTLNQEWERSLTPARVWRCAACGGRAPRAGHNLRQQCEGAGVVEYVRIDLYEQVLAELAELKA